MPEIRAQALEKGKIREQAIKDNLKKLQAAGIKCEIKENAILGWHKGEPFCVFLQWVHATDTHFAGVIVTRYKGEDRFQDEPVEVLKK